MHLNQAPRSRTELEIVDRTSSSFIVARVHVQWVPSLPVLLPGEEWWVWVKRFYSSDSFSILGSTNSILITCRLLEGMCQSVSRMSQGQQWERGLL